MDRWVDDDTGMHHTLLVLDPVRDAEVHAAIEHRIASMVADRADRTMATTVDAVVALLTDQRITGPGRPHVSVLVDATTIEHGHHTDTVAEYEDGTPIPPSVLDRHLCDPVLTLLGLDRAGQVLRAIKARTASATQRHALRAMHPTCAHPGCASRSTAARSTTSTTGDTVAPPDSTTSSRCVRPTTTSSTTSAGTTTSPPTDSSS